MKVLVTGADGLRRARWLVPAPARGGARGAGRGIRPGGPPAPDSLPPSGRRGRLAAARARSTPPRCGAVVAAARTRWCTWPRSPRAPRPGATRARAWEVNAARHGARWPTRSAGARQDGRGRPAPAAWSRPARCTAPAPARPRRETDPLLPCSPYAASKVGRGGRGAGGRRAAPGSGCVVARPFPHTGPGQSDRVRGAGVRRAGSGRRGGSGAPVVKTGNLEPVRDFLACADVVSAYLALLDAGRAGRGLQRRQRRGHRARRPLRAAGRRCIGVAADRRGRIPRLMRTADIPHLVGDAVQAARGDRVGAAPSPSTRPCRTSLDAQAD